MTSCQFNATLGGIGAFVSAGPTAGHLSLIAGSAVNGKIYTYYAQSFDNAIPPNITAWEAGSGAFITPSIIQRTTIIANSNGDLLPVNFPLPPIVDVYASPAGRLEPIQDWTSPPVSVTLTTNGQLGFQATSNTVLTIKFRGSDGVTRSVALTLT